MQLRQCFPRAKPFRLKKIQKKPDFVWLFSSPKKAKGVQKRPEFQNLASKKAKLATLLAGHQTEKRGSC